MVVLKYQVKFLSLVFLMVSASMTLRAGEVLHLRAGAIQASNFQFNSQMQNADHQEFLVQYKNKITDQSKETLAAFGAEVLRYIPDDALLVKADWETLKNLNDADVRLVVPYVAAYKISPDFTLSVLSQSQLILVKSFAQNEAVSETIQNLSEENIIYMDEDSFVLAEVRALDIPQIAKLHGVEFIQPYAPMTPFHFDLGFEDSASKYKGNKRGNTYQDPIVLGTGDYTDLNGYESGTRVMNAVSAWNKGFTGSGQIVAMADTGLDSGDAKNIHPDFSNAISKGVAYGMFSKSWSDPMGHGTHVAGSILGRGTASKGVLRGAAYNASMVVQGLWSPTMENLTVPPKLDKLFSQAYADGARLHSNSWGSPKDFGVYDSFAAQVDDFMFKNQEMLIIFAAGNNGEDLNKDGRIDNGSVSSPGTSKNTLTVGASENLLSTGGIQVPIGKLRAAKDKWPSEPISSDTISNNVNGIAMFSSRGPCLDGRLKPEIVAPGTNILSARSHVQGASELWGAYNQDYVYSGGTSMATPLTAGAAAIARQYLAEKRGMKNPSSALVKAFLMVNADEMYPGQFGEVGKAKGQEMITHRPNNEEGYGRVDIANIVDFAGQIYDEKNGVAQGQEITYNINVVNKFRTSKFSALLVWTDAPASPSASKTLVNDLDIVLVKANGEQVSLNDHVNNNELIELDKLETGLHKLVVKGNRVASGINGKQPFALVINN